MNKYVTLLILGVVLCAMGMIVYFHASGEPERPVASAQNAQSEPSTQALNATGGTGLPGVSGAATPATGAATTDPSQVADTVRNGSTQGGGLPRVEPPLSGDSGQSAQGRSPQAQGSGAVSGAPSAMPAASVQGVPGQGGTSASQGQDRSVAGTPQSAAARNGTSASDVSAATGQPAQSNGTKTPAAATGRADQGSGAKTPAGAAGQNGQAASAPQTGQGKPADASGGTASAQTPALSLTGKHTLKDISLHFAGQRMRVRIEAEDPFPCKTFILTSPDRLVVDLPGTWKGMRAPEVPQNNVIKSVRYGTQSAGPRLVLDLGKAPKYEVTRPSPNVVEINVQ